MSKNLGRKELFGFALPQHSLSPRAVSTGAQSETWEKEVKQRPEEMLFTDFNGLLSPLSQTTQNHPV